MTIINISGIELSSNCFLGTNVASVDLNNVSIQNNSMCVYLDVLNRNGDGEFVNCSNLTSVTNINNNVINMSSAFLNCSSLIDAPIIPNSVRDMSGTFAGCSFLANAPVIPNSVTNLAGTFYGCPGIVNAPVIPNSVTNMYGMFFGCVNLVNVPDIPNGVVDMADAFDACLKLVNAPVIPNSVTNILGAFAYTKIAGDVIIKSENIINAYRTFAASLSDKNVYIPFTYQNGVHTLTYNSFITAGYSATTRNQGTQLFDLNDYLLANRAITVVFTNSSTGNDVGNGYYFSATLKKDDATVNTINDLHSGNSVIIGDADTITVRGVAESQIYYKPITNTYSLTSLSNGDTLTIPCQQQGGLDPTPGGDLDW